MIVAEVVINLETVTGKGCIINTCVSVNHDCDTSDFVRVVVGLDIAGTVQIGVRTWIGAGAMVVHDIDVPGIYVEVSAHKV